jgi:mannose-6-phosphate isomerase-like protein (cupin superfamily)
MSLLPQEIIPFEQHDQATQFIRVESGRIVVTIEENPNSGTFKQVSLSDGKYVIIPPNTWHQVDNISETTKTKLYTIYTPPTHEEGVIEPVQVPEINNKIFGKISYNEKEEKFGLLISPQGKVMIIDNETGQTHCKHRFESRYEAIKMIQESEQKRPDVCPVCSKGYC